MTLSIFTAGISACGVTHAGRKKTEKTDEELSKLEKKCSQRLLQKRKQSENDDMQMKIRFIESRFKLVQSHLSYFMLAIKGKSGVSVGEYKLNKVCG